MCGKKNGLSSNPQRTLDYFEAVEFYFEQGLTDGLPVVPPTPDRLAQFLDAANLKPDDVVGVVSVGAIPITAEKVALNAIMAGCLPDYMPVIVAGIHAMIDDEFSLNATAASTSGASHMLVVGGEVVDDLGINYGVNMLGPGTRPNATIGRAIRLILMNVCGTLPDVLDKSTLGNPGKYTSCIAEDESLTPWPPLRTDYGIPDSPGRSDRLRLLRPGTGVGPPQQQRRGGPHAHLGRHSHLSLLRPRLRDHGHPRTGAPGPRTSRRLEQEGRAAVSAPGHATTHGLLEGPPRQRQERGSGKGWDCRGLRQHRMIS